MLDVWRKKGPSGILGTSCVMDPYFGWFFRLQRSCKGWWIWLSGVASEFVLKRWKTSVAFYHAASSWEKSQSLHASLLEWSRDGWTKGQQFRRGGLAIKVVVNAINKLASTCDSISRMHDSNMTLTHLWLNYCLSHTVYTKCMYQHYQCTFSVLL